MIDHLMLNVKITKLLLRFFHIQQQLNPTTIIFLWNILEQSPNYQIETPFSLIYLAFFKLFKILSRLILNICPINCIKFHIKIKLYANISTIIAIFWVFIFLNY